MFHNSILTKFQILRYFTTLYSPNALSCIFFTKLLNDSSEFQVSEQKIGRTTFQSGTMTSKFMILILLTYKLKILHRSPGIVRTLTYMRGQSVTLCRLDEGTKITPIFPAEISCIRIMMNLMERCWK